MGFFKRFFSISTRKKKNNRVLPDPALERIQEEEQEAAASRLLRSSSSRFTVVSEVDYANLPPMPHPIDHIMHLPAASTTTLSSTTQRSTFSVTVHRRTRHALTEFPNANPPMPTRADAEVDTPRARREYTIPLSRPLDSTRGRSKSTPFPMTPRDANRLQRLRQDPSVASLVNLYDEHGCLPLSAFSNSPPSPRRERAQVRRNGSTLRQLLGDPKPRTEGEDNSGQEGDISWAERFLGETDANSSTSSLGHCLRTPTELDIPFMRDRKDDHSTLSITHNLSNVNDIDVSANYPTFSSLEVEVSMVADSPPLSASHQPTSPYLHENPLTPQRASQVFGFLTERRQTRNLLEDVPISSGRPTPLPLSAFQSPSKSRFSDTSTDCYALDESCRNVVPNDLNGIPADPTIPGTRSRSPSSFASDNDAVVDNASLRGSQSNTERLIDLDSISHHQKQVEDACMRRASMLNARTVQPTTEHPLCDQAKPGLKGPRPRPSQPPHEPRPNDVERAAEYRKSSTRGALVDKSRQSNYHDTKDPFSPMPSRRSKAHRRTASPSSLTLTHSSEHDDKRPTTPVLPVRTAERWARKDGEKENGGGMSSQAASLFVTPTKKQLRISAVAPPSPASSSEMSPVGRQLMTNLREQRMRGREAEKQRRVRLSTGVGDLYRW